MKRILLVAAAAAIFAAGCGDATKDYVHKVNNAEAAFGRAVLNAKDSPSAGVKAIASLADDLDHIKDVPDAIRSDHRALVSEFRRTAVELATKTEDPTAFKAGVAADDKRLRLAIEAVNHDIDE